MESKHNEHIDILIINYLSNQIETEEKEFLLKWIDDSEDNYLHFAHLKNIWDNTHAPFSPDEIDVEDGFKKISQQIKKPRNFRLITWAGRIAAVIVVSLLSIGLYQYFTKEDNYEPVFQEIYAPYGTFSNVELPDGSIVYLNSGSQLKFPVQFKKGERVVQLNGEALFEVKADKRNPFVVCTQSLTVTATGTIFQVEDFKGDTIAAVTMKEGVVDVSILSSPPIDLKAGRRLCYQTNTNRYSIQQTDPYKWYAWKDGVMIFRNDPLSYVFRRLNLTFNVNIECKDAEIGNHIYRATFRNESLEEILRLLKISSPIVYKEKTRNNLDSDRPRNIEVYSSKKK